MASARIAVCLLLVCSGVAWMTPDPDFPPVCAPGEPLMLRPGKPSFQIVKVNKTNCFRVPNNSPNQISFGKLQVAAHAPEHVLLWVRSGNNGKWIHPIAVAPGRGRRPHGATQVDANHHIFNGLSTNPDDTVMIALKVVPSDAHPTSNVMVNLQLTFPAPHCQFKYAKRDSNTPTIENQTLCEAINVHADAPFHDTVNPTAGVFGLAADHVTRTPMFVAYRKVIDLAAGLYSSWARLEPGDHKTYVYSVPVRVKAENHFQFIVMNNTAHGNPTPTLPATQVRFHITGLLECPRPAKAAEYDMTTPIPFENDPIACYSVAVPGIHDPGNYMETKLTMAPREQEIFRVYARYDPSRPWNQITLGSEATVIKADGQLESSYKVPVPQSLIGTQKKASIMIVARQSMVATVVFSKPALDCKDFYTDDLQGYLPGCPSEGCTVYGTLDAAKAACDKLKSCHGVTRKSSKDYETRTGAWPKLSDVGEVSWVKHPTATLGKLISDETVSVSKPLCFMVEMGARANVMNADLVVAVQATDEDVSEFYKAYTMDASNQWKQMDALPREGRTRSFAAHAQKGRRVVPVALVSATLASTGAMITFNVREAHMEKPEAEMLDTCSSTNNVVMNKHPGLLASTHLAVQQATCVAVELPEHHNMFKSLRLVVNSSHPLPKLIVKSREVSEASTDELTGGNKHKTKFMHGFLQVLKMIKERVNRAHNLGQSQKADTFWAVVPEAGSTRFLQYFYYDLPAGKDQVEFMLALHNSAVSHHNGIAPLSNIDISLSFDMITPHCSTYERVPLGRAVMSRAQSSLHTETVACYTIALTEQNLQHSDRIFAKLSPASAAEHVDIYVQGAKQRGVRLSAPHLQGDVATYTHCTSRVQDPITDSCDRMEITAQATLLRFAVVARPGPEPVPFSLKLENFGPSCKFPRKADISGDSEHTVDLGPDNHVCYEVKAGTFGPKPQKSRLPKVVMDLLTKKNQPQAVRAGKFKLHIKATDADSEVNLSKIRVYSRQPGSDAWLEILGHRIPKGSSEKFDDTEYTATFGMSADSLLAYQSTVETVKPGTKQEAYAKTFVEALGKPTFLSFSVDSPGLVKYVVYFEEVIEEQHKKAAESSRNQLKWVIGGILAAGVLVVAVIIQCVRRSPEAYQRIDSQSVAMQKFNTLQDTDEDIMADKFDDIEIAAFDEEEEYEVDDTELDDYSIADDTPETPAKEAETARELDYEF